MSLPFSPCRLIVNADDFGLTEGINRAVGELAGAGALSSATLMANGTALDDAVHIAGAGTGLQTGCHVVLVDGIPVADPGKVQSLVDATTGHLRSSLPRFILDLQRNRIPEIDIETEATAQIQRLQDRGIHVTHVDTHKHTHLFPRVARPLMRAAMRCGIRAIRNPFEQEWSARLTRGAVVRRLEVAALRHFERRFHQLRRAAHLRTTAGSIGISATGRLDAATLADLLRAAGAGHDRDATWELVCHPGYNDAALDAVSTRLRGTRDVEREALSTLLPAAVREGVVQLVSFADL